MNLTKEERKWYNRGYYAGARRVTIYHLGSKCVDCGEAKLSQLEIHHINGLDRKSRRLTDYKNLKELELKCKTCHASV